MMQQANLQSRDIQTLLEKWQGKEIQVMKEENGDKDHIHLLLEKAEINDRDETIDEYISKQFICLYGQGTVAFEGSAQPLPHNRYEIPIDTIYDGHYDGVQLYLTTNRGSYILTGPSDCH